MIEGVFGAVLLAALMNAIWNSLIKIGGDKTIIMALTTLLGSFASIIALPFISFTFDLNWIMLTTSIVVHTVYHLVLAAAYRHADLGHVYPIARGGAPILVTLLAATAIWEIPSGVELAGIVCLSIGVLAFATRHRPTTGSNLPGTLYAIATSGLIAAYTIVDGIGARSSASAISFAALLTIGDGVATALVVLLWRGRAAYSGVDRRALLLSGFAGTMQVGSYWIAVWAFTQAPMGSVAALRESSILFVTLISSLLLKERVGLHRIGCSAIVLMGLLLVRLGR